MLQTIVSAYGPSPIVTLGRADRDEVDSFVASLGEEARAARFCRRMTPGMVALHYQALDWERAVVLGWVEEGAIRGVCEVHFYAGCHGLEAEVAYCVAEAWRGRGIGQLLLELGVETAAGRGAMRSVLVLGGPRDVQARVARRLGGTIDRECQVAVLPH